MATAPSKLSVLLLTAGATWWQPQSQPQLGPPGGEPPAALAPSAGQGHDHQGEPQVSGIVHAGDTTRQTTGQTEPQPEDALWASDQSEGRGRNVKAG